MTKEQIIWSIAISLTSTVFGIFLTVLTKDIKVNFKKLINFLVKLFYIGSIIFSIFIIANAFIYDEISKLFIFKIMSFSFIITLNLISFLILKILDLQVKTVSVIGEIVKNITK